MEFVKKIFIFIAFLLNFLITKLALAATANPLIRMRELANSANLPASEATPQRIIINIIVYILGFVGLFFVISIIYAGFKWTTSGGNEENIKKAKDRLKNSIIGVAIILASYVITFTAADILTKTTTSGYYSIPVNGNPSGDCRNNLDCLDQFGSSWICQGVDVHGQICTMRFGDSSCRGNSCIYEGRCDNDAYCQERFGNDYTCHSGECIK